MRRDAAALACVCRAAAAAAPASKWRSAVRIGPSGHVLEPASGAFDVTVAPGEDVQAAVDACPRGGSVLLLPGSHDGPLFLAHRKKVHVFGRGRATLRAARGNVVFSEALKSTLDGLVLRREAGGINRDTWVRSGGVEIAGSALRMQACDITSLAGNCVFIWCRARPTLVSCRQAPLHPEPEYFLFRI